MTSLIHVLGSDIPHHNHTVLRFFNDALASRNPEARIFMVVGYEGDLKVSCPELSLTFFSNKTTLSKVVVKKAQEDRGQRFFFHGQFNIGLWLALLTGEIKSIQFNWHIWGADLYEVSRNWKFLLFYPFRRMAQGLVGCVFGTRGDLTFFRKLHPTVRGELLYFPTRMSLSLSQRERDGQCKNRLTILVGNSGDRSNEHIDAMDAIHRQFGDTVKLIIPMGYPSDNGGYVNQVRRYGTALFGLENLHILSKKLRFDEYFLLLRKCDLGYFGFTRQQGIGTLCLLIQAGVPFVLNQANPFCQDMAEQNIPVLFTSDLLNAEVIHETKRKLSLLDKSGINFFYPGYLALWRQVLKIASGSKG